MGDGDDLEERILSLALTTQLLVACDYDGAIAPTADDPMRAAPRPETVDVLRALAALPRTEVAVISGRALRDLATMSRLPREVRLVGSHGSEFGVTDASELPDSGQQLRRRIEAELGEIAASAPGALLEPKPTAVAFHYRHLEAGRVDDVLAAIERGPGGLEGVRVRRGDQVVELSVVDTDKGAALDSIRRSVSASAVLFLGDGSTDEDAFATLGGPDVGVKIGSGGTVAPFRIEPDLVTPLLALLHERRLEWLRGAPAIPIEQHAILSDQRTTAIVSPTGRIAWMCVPRIDSAALFAELVGGPNAGAFSVWPAHGGGPVDQRYVDRSLVLETRWPGLVVSDYLDCSAGRTGRSAGRSDLVRVLSGTCRAVIEFSPRLDFGRYPTRLEVRPDGLEVVSAADLVVLRAPGLRWQVAADGPHQMARAEVELSSGDVTLELRCGTASLRPDPIPEVERRRATSSFWSNWGDALKVPPPPAAEVVRRSALTLKALCHGPTGAIAAAATTSLPEQLGGVRNWDYRYCWLRDAALSASALVRLGSTDEAMGFLDWLLRVLESHEDPARLSPLYLVTGRHLPPEAEIAELAGYAGSRPVRIGNAAERQVQLDVFGPVVDLIASLLDAGAPLSSQHWRLVEAMVRAVELRWSEPDHGIWEIRKQPRHHVYSKVMCWLTVDRALRVVEELQGRRRVDWVDLRERIAEDVLTKGWKEEVGAFTAAYDGVDLDASVLAVGLTGLVPPDDRRFVATVEAVERSLRDGATVYRYRADDGLPGTEGGFHLMTSWLVDALLLVGRFDDASALFDQLVALAGPTGLLSEEYSPIDGRALGNFPQAYSHLGVINNALNLDGPRRPGVDPVS